MTVHSEPSSHGYSRLVNFCDAVVAIAITLLILPLVDAAKNVGSLTAGQFTAQNVYGIIVFLVSFAVTGRFWIEHHRLYERVRGYTRPLIWANLLWLASIVFLAFPTQLLGSVDRHDETTYLVYIGTMLMTCLATVVQIVILKRHPDIQATWARDTFRVSLALAPALLMALALALTALVPSVGLWSLLVLLLTRPLNLLTARFRRSDG
jgi:uncharacterized membrane protein